MLSMSYRAPCRQPRVHPSSQRPSACTATRVLLPDAAGVKYGAPEQRPRSLLAPSSLSFEADFFQVVDDKQDLVGIVRSDLLSRFNIGLRALNGGDLRISSSWTPTCSRLRGY